jgi:hypothetical protein
VGRRVPATPMTDSFPTSKALRWVRTILVLTVVAAVAATAAIASAAAPAPVVRTLSSEGTSAVNPLNFYQAEPAPVGIADFGIGASGTPYSYTTSSFLGSISITRLEVNSTATGTAAVGLANTTVGNSAPVQTVGNTFLPVDALGVTFQLNVVLSFVNAGTTYVYWVQDVAGLTPGACSSSNPVLNFTDYFVGCTGLTSADNSTAGSIAFQNNVWNFSEPGASMYSSSISGNGSVSSFDGIGYYATSASATAPGNEVTIEYPTDVQFQVGSTRTAQGIPQISFEYDDGYGWQTFDSPVFPFATHVSSDEGYVVDGYEYNPYGLYYDAELTVGGAGAGTYSGLGPATNLYFTESYWNGHNFEAIPSAYNFGSDTAESVKFVSSSALFESTTGAVGDLVLGGGSGPLGPSYNSNQLGTVSLTTPASSGTVSIGGDANAYQGGAFVQRVGPTVSGPYDVTVAIGGSTVWSGFVTVAAGATASVDTADYHAVTYQAKGLATGAAWELTVASTTYTGTASSLTVYLENGRYSWSASSAGYATAKGTVTVKGAALTVSVTLKK